MTDAPIPPVPVVMVPRGPEPPPPGLVRMGGLDALVAVWRVVTPEDRAAFLLLLTAEGGA